MTIVKLIVLVIFLHYLYHGDLLNFGSRYEPISSSSVESFRLVTTNFSHPKVLTKHPSPRRETMTLWHVFRDFSVWTSSHGVPHIGMGQNYCLRIFWTIVSLASLGMFCWQMYLLVEKYLEYNITVQTQLMFQQRSFPAVTICNLNPYFADIAYTYPTLATILDQYDAAMDGNRSTPFFQNMNDSIDIQSRAQALLKYQVIGNLNLGIGNTIYSQLNDFIINCAYNTKPCDIKNDWTPILDPAYGVCFQFNNQVPPTYNSTRAGPLYGLRVLVKSNQSDYIGLTEAAGVRVAIHNQGEPPFPDSFGYNAAAGFTTSFGVQYIETQRLGSPWGACTGRPPKAYYYNTSSLTPYSAEACFRSCLQDQIVKICGCADPSFKKSSSSNYCSSLSDYLCVSDATSPTGTVSISQCSGCQLPCDDSEYTVTVSTALWPSEVYIPPDCNDLTNQWGGNQTLCQQWYGENTMLVEVYYERMNYQLLTEQAAYGIINLISDTGGQLGLWAGFSVITLIEFGALFVFLMLYCCCSPKGGQNDRVHPVEDPNQGKHEMNTFDNNEGGSPPPPYSENEPPKMEENPAEAPPHPIEENPNKELPGEMPNQPTHEAEIRNRPASVRSMKT